MSKIQTRLGVFAAKVAESSWLISLVVVPVLFNIYTERIFEEDKIPLMRSLALFAALALLVYAIEHRQNPMEMGAAFWKIPLVTPALVLAGAYVLSSFLGILPQVSLWGAYLRRQGTYTWLSYLVFFFAVVVLVRKQEQVERFVTVILIASIPPALYGVFQQLGQDPLPWSTDYGGRAKSTGGHPNFNAALLMMVVPFTLVRLLEEGGRLREIWTESGRNARYFHRSLVVLSYLLLLLLQMTALLYSQSRGPFLGLGIGVTVFFMLFALRRGQRLLARVIVGLAVAGAFSLVLFNLPNSPLRDLRNIPYFGRLGTIFEARAGSGMERVWIWDGIMKLIASNPSRLILGYGPDALYQAYAPFHPAELAVAEPGTLSMDRAHNETFDALLTTGILGLGAELAVFVLLFYHALNWLGLIISVQHRKAFWLAIVVGASAGTLTPYFIDGGFRFAGLGFSSGVILGVIGYIFVFVWRQCGRYPSRPLPLDLVLAALFAAATAHFVELQFGIAIAATRSYFWIYAGFGVVIGMRRVMDEPADRPSHERDYEIDWLGLIVGLTCMIMTFSLYHPTLTDAAKRATLLCILLGIWSLAWFLFAGRSSDNNRLPTIARFFRYSITSLGSLGLFFAFLAYWVNYQPEDIPGSLSFLQQGAAHHTNTIAVLYLFVFAVVTFSAGVFAVAGKLPEQTSRATLRHALMYVLLLSVTVVLIIRANLNISRADIYSQLASECEQRGQPAIGEIYYQEALRLRPRETRYFLNLGRVLSQQGLHHRGKPALMEDYFMRSQAALQEAFAIDPFSPENVRNLATLQRIWSSNTNDPVTRQNHFYESDKCFALAIQRSPNIAAVWTEWASLHLEAGRLTIALPKLDQALRIDGTLAAAYLLRARVYAGLHVYDKALADYEAVLRLDPNSNEAKQGQAKAASLLSRP